jgi:transcriptional regulator with XRE-family HTH domain
MKRRLIKKQMDIAAQVYELTQAKGWTQKELANQSGVSEQQLSNIMSGHANPTLKTLVKLEEVFNADIVVAPKFYKKALNKEGYTIVRQSMAENFQLDLEEWVNRHKEVILDEKTFEFVINLHGSDYSISTQELCSQNDVKIA